MKKKMNFVIAVILLVLLIVPVFYLKLFRAISVFLFNLTLSVKLGEIKYSWIPGAFYYACRLEFDEFWLGTYSLIYRDREGLPIAIWQGVFDWSFPNPERRNSIGS